MLVLKLKYLRCLSLHCNQRLVLLLTLFTHGEHFRITRFLIKHWTIQSKTHKKNFRTRKWKWFYWTLSLLWSMKDFLIRPSTGGICCTQQNLPPRTGSWCFTQTFFTKVEAPATLLHRPRLHLPSYLLPSSSLPPNTLSKPQENQHGEGTSWVNNCETK